MKTNVIVLVALLWFCQQFSRRFRQLWTLTKIALLGKPNNRDSLGGVVKDFLFIVWQRRFLCAWQLYRAIRCQNYSMFSPKSTRMCLIWRLRRARIPSRGTSKKMSFRHTRKRFRRPTKRKSLSTSFSLLVVKEHLRSLRYCLRQCRRIFLEPVVDSSTGK